MCGIGGYVLARGVERDAGLVLGMLRAMRHRGPDDEGAALLDPAEGRAWNVLGDESDPRAEVDRRIGGAQPVPHRIALGHRRFSIIDLSPAGHQPFWSSDGRVAVAFNGEIFNYVEVRAELERAGVRFATQSDTEVLALAYRAWGTDAFRRLNGFWAVALYDAEKRKLLLARDRIGKAPLYVTRRADGLWFSSEIKGLLAALGVSAFTPDTQAVYDFVRHGWRDLFGSTFYAEIKSFPPASFAWVADDGSFQPERYWSVPAERRAARVLPVAAAAREIRDLLEDAVRIRLRADVPVGLDLSGGLDSSTILAFAVLARKGSGGRLRAVTVSYPGHPLDELHYARQVVERYAEHVDHTVLTPVGDDDVLGDLDAFVALMDQPVHGPQLAAHHRIWSAMRDAGVRVNLNGAAGDELLAGYGSDYFEPYLRSLFARGRFTRFAREFFRYSEDDDALGFHHLRRVYHLLPDALRPYTNRALEVPADEDPFRVPEGIARRVGPSREINRLLLDTMTDWRMNYWCLSGNQNAMGVPLELRCPFLDHRVVESAFTMPLEYLIRDGWLKWILRVALEDLLPPSITWRRRKVGFQYPLNQWLPKSKETLLRWSAESRCPFIDQGRLSDGYDGIVARNPNYLWRVLSVALWWRRCVMGESLDVDGSAPRRPGRSPTLAESPRP